MGYEMYWRERPPEMIAAADAARLVWDEAIAVRDALPREESGRARNREDWHRENEDLPFSEYVGRTERFHAAQAAVLAAGRAWDRAKQFYFRLNIRGMGYCCDLMDQFDMVYRSESEGEWPDEPVGRDDPWSDRDELEEAGVPVEDWPADLREWQDALTYKLSSGVQERPGIALHKFDSNDGWIVTPVECMGAVEQWKRAVLGPPQLGSGGEDRRVATLLAKATDRAVTPFESEAFTAKAMELMKEHDLPEWWPEWIAFLVGAAQHGGFEVN